MVDLMDMELPIMPKETNTKANGKMEKELDMAPIPLSMEINTSGNMRRANIMERAPIIF